MDSLQKAHAEIGSLRPGVIEQDVLEKEIEALRINAAAMSSLDERLSAAEKRRSDLRVAYKSHIERLKDLETKAAAAADIDPLQRRDAELTRSIAALTASLERDRKFQAEIKGGCCPVLSERCLNLKEGQTLEAFVTTQFAELQMQIETAEDEHRAVADGLRRAREAAAHAAALAEFRNHITQLEEDGKRAKDEIEELTARRSELAGADSTLLSAEAKLKELGDPRGRIRLLERVTAREMELRQSRSEIEANLERLESERRLLTEEMEAYRNLDAKWSSLSDEREATVAGHRIYLSSETEAQALDECQKNLDSARRELMRSTQLEEEAQKKLREAESNYDPAVHKCEREMFREIERQNVRLRSELTSAAKRADELAAELARFTEVRRSMRDELREKEHLEGIAETTTFIRDTLKEAAPRVARNYVYHVSIEAAQMFREITGNAEYTLKWAEDYSIVMEENGYERPFASLSGGEQMAAALSVRLALLKQLTDIRVAFFDEPTANMDAERRENLAVQISRITHFDQLFVISHDETFDNFVDNVISIERAAA
jgi:exonuclease SbcC